MKRAALLLTLASLLVRPSAADALAGRFRLSQNTPSRVARVASQAQPITSQGVVITGADAWHASAFTGSGQKIALLCKGFQGYQDLVAIGELPASLITHSFRSDGNLEAGEAGGSACAEIVHDMAPDAKLYLVNADTEAEFASAVSWLIDQGVSVVCCSLSWIDTGPFNGTGPVCDVVNHARDHDIFWSQAAGDLAQAHWGGAWSDSDGDGVHEFDSGDESQSMNVPADATVRVNLLWDDPWDASANDYDLYLHDATGLVVASSTRRQDGTGSPSESIAYSVGPHGAGQYHFRVIRVSSDRAAHLELYSLHQVLEHQVSAGSMAIPADASGAVASGASNWLDDALELFSSRGPTQDGRGKPEFACPDRVVTVSYPGGFAGTSAGAAHLAGAAALVRCAHSGYSAAETLAFLRDRATDRGPPGWDNEYGYGRLWLGAAPATPTATATATSSPTPTYTPSPSPTATRTATSSPTPTPTPSSTPTVSQDEATLTLQQGVAGYLGSQTTYIYQYAPDTSYCSDSSIKVGVKQQYAALARFDLAPIPADATITRATLQLYAYAWSGANIGFGAYVITPTTALCQSTWNRPRSGALWGLPGANDISLDRRPSPLGTATTSGINKWYSLDLTSAVQAWLNGTLANNGVLLRQTVFSPEFVVFAGSMASESARRPRLVVAYRGGSQPGATPTHSQTPTDPPVPSATPTRTPTGALASTPTHTVTATGTATASAADTIISLQQGANGYAGGASTYVYQYSPDSNYCSSSSLKVGSKQQYAALVRFDLSLVPQDATVSQATLQLYSPGWSGVDISLATYVVSRTTALCLATWNRSRGSESWAAPGANDGTSDRRPQAESGLTTAGTHKWYTFDLTSATQLWVSGALPNNGILLRQSASSVNSMSFAGNTSAEVWLRPKLVIVYRSGNSAPTPTAAHSPTPTRSPSASATSTPTATGPGSSTPTRSPTPSPTSAGGAGDFTVALQQGSNGYGGSQTTYIYQYSADSNYCQSGSLKVGSKQQYAALARFDLSPIPSDATVSEASLQIYATGWSGANISVGAYVITRTAALCQATWNRSTTANPWGLPGANDINSDRRPAPDAVVTTSGIHKWYAFNLTEVVRAWHGGLLPNNGALLRQSVGTASAFAFTGNGTADVNLRPRLVIKYSVGSVEPSPTPDTLVIAHITDAHIGLGPLEPERLALVLQLIDGQAQVLVDTGDCTNDGTLEQTQEYARIVNSNTTVPWRAVPGNHDVPWVFEAYISPLAWSWDVGNYRLIGINTESIDYPALDAALTIDRPCIVVGHFPIDACNPGDQALLRDRFRTYHVPLYLAGHDHYSSQTIDPETGTMLVVGQRVPTYRIIAVRGYEVQNVEPY